MSSGAPPIGPHDGAARERLRDLMALHAVRDALAPLRLAIGFGKVDRALDVVLDADRIRGGVLEGLGLPRASLAHQLRLVLASSK